jgi:fatty acid desaturase
MRFYIKDSARKPDPEPVKTNAKLVFTVGTIAWTVALLVVLLAYPSLAPAEQSLWPLTCGVGVTLGLIGLIRVRQR